ncbi:hypothetical protein J31TS4_00900 [Paenibacillus sp. J31TS4]|uniref:FliH/SctL family protein n=1 Tax=Paenibacillus sp. J31TS4 TaxID=2807195 RepID=UPI001B13FA6A|nr:FliH/SctL family protein [Paenibacillus sp. J31TS4]GIP36810.1 hypothetical protein J31TS4_00900 [Paenibacillus sp. J31TS4]
MSNLIKPVDYVSLDAKTIHPLLELAKKQVLRSQHASDAAFSEQEREEIGEARQMRDRILEEAEQLAEERVREAHEQAALLQEQARREIEEWWNERRAADAEASEEARQLGFEQGYQQGFREAEQSVHEQYSETISEIRGSLEKAFAKKRQIVQEAEPFLIEMSISIAEKIIRKQLELEPDWVVDLTKHMLSRKKTKGQLTLCVSPSQFEFLYDARDELKLAVDSQAELLIVPDSTVEDEGCVIRSDSGSLDARIDTQLMEIKQALLQLAAAESEAGDDDDD